MRNLSKAVVFDVVNAAVTAASNTDDNSSIIDMQNYDGVAFLVPITDSVATGVATLKVAGNTSNSATGMAALVGASATATSAENCGRCVETTKALCRSCYHFSNSEYRIWRDNRN